MREGESACARSRVFRHCVLPIGDMGLGFRHCVLPIGEMASCVRRRGFRERARERAKVQRGTGGGRFLRRKEARNFWP